MEHAVYKVFVQGGRQMGSFVDMLASREEAEAYAQRLEGEHRVVGLWTREIDPDDEHLWDTVVFDKDGGVEPVGEVRPSA